MFFSFDGIDGVGKTTQVERFAEWLTEVGHDVVTCRDPGSTPLGERIREILLTRDKQLAISRRSEMLLYMAARAQLVDEVIRPALEAGKIVVSDRYVLANIVYQGHAGGVDVEAVRQVGAATIDGIMPDAVFLLDMSTGEAADRLHRPLDRMERQGKTYRENLRQGFLGEARRHPERIHVIDAARPIDKVQQEIRDIARVKLAG